MGVRFNFVLKESRAQACRRILSQKPSFQRYRGDELTIFKPVPPRTSEPFPRAWSVL